MATLKSTSLFLIGLLTATTIAALPPQRQAMAQQAPPSARCAAAPESRQITATSQAAGAYTALLTPERMIPGDEYLVAVTVTNTTTRSLNKADYVLSYRWRLPDGTDQTRPSNRAETVMPADLAPGQSVTVDATVKAPTQIDPRTQRQAFILNWDLRNRGSGKWLSESDGVAPLKQTADFPASNQLGLEKFYHYNGIAAGAGWTASVDQFSGNAVVGYSALTNPGRGLSAFVRLNHNSLDGSNSYVGPGWSLSISSLPRLGSPLLFHVPLLGDPNYPAKVTLVDGDGTTHLFRLNKNNSSDKSKWTYDNPADVHLFLRGREAATKTGYG